MRNLPRWLIPPTILMAILTLGLVGSVIRLREALQGLHVVTENRTATMALAAELRQSSDDLTRMARTYVDTGDPRFKAYYYRILAIRDGKVPRPETYGRVYWDFVTADHRYPAVPDGEARLRFFLCSDHTEEQIHQAAAALREVAGES